MLEKIKIDLYRLLNNIRIKFVRDMKIVIKMNI